MERVIPYDIEKKVIGYIAELREIDRERREVGYNEAIKKTLRLLKTTGAEIDTTLRNLELNLVDVLQ